MKTLKTLECATCVLALGAGSLSGFAPGQLSGGFLPAVVATTLPDLLIESSGGTVRLSWSDTCPGFVVEATGRIDSRTWTILGTGAPVADRRELVLPLASGHSFFRLQKDCGGCLESGIDPTGNPIVSVDAVCDFGASGVDAQSVGNMAAGSPVLTLTGAGLPLRIGS
jgi:hypothetical protein